MSSCECEDVQWCSLCWRAGPGAGSRGVADEASLSSNNVSSETEGPEQSALCGGGGGAHVGSGGDGVHALTGKACSGSGGLSYDRGPRMTLTDHLSVAGAASPKEKSHTENNSPVLFVPTASASGGGGDLARAGSGGGFVWVQGQTVTVDGQIIADGGGGELMQEAIIDVEVNADTCPPRPSPLAETLNTPPDAAKEANTGNGKAASSGASPGEVRGESPGAPADVLQQPGRSFTKTEASFASLAQETIEAVKAAPGDPTAPTAGMPTLDSVSCQLSGILADPAQLGQGGGAGGSVVIEAGALTGHGTISAQGGHGGRCTGGGGGGGAIDLLWDTSLLYWRGNTPAQQQRAHRSRQGGAGSPFSGHVAEEEVGLTSEGKPDPFIPWLKPLDYASGFVGTLKVNGGGSDPSPACAPLQLPLGHRGSPGEVRSPFGCPPGYAGWSCRPCPIGFYSVDGGTACLSCKNKPSDDAIYTREGVGGPECPFACAAGLPDASINPKCLPAFMFILDNLLCFAVLVPTLAVCIALLGLAVLLRELARRQRQQGWAYGALFGLLSPGSSPDEGGLESAATPSGFMGLQPSPSNSLGYVAGSNEKRLMHLSVHHLTSEDLPFHVLRIYLHGRNSPDSPWGLDGQPPPFLDPLITPHRFAAFAAAANSICGFSRSFVLVHGALSFVYPAFAALLLRYARARRADKMITLCSALSGVPSGVGEGGLQSSLRWERRRPWSSLLPFLRLERDVGTDAAAEVSGAVSFWRSIRARELSFALKFGCDPDCTLGFVDVLDLDRNILDYRCSPQLPMVLLIQGDGKVVPFSLSGGLRAPGAPRAALGPRPADGEGSPADPLQRALEELASPSVWACIAHFFSAKVKELTAEELSSLKAFTGTGECPSSGGQKEGPSLEGWAHDGKNWPGTGGHCSAEREAPAYYWVPRPFSRCGRCGKLQLPPAPEASGGRALGMLMGGPLYALRTVARLSEGIRLMSDRILRPHGIGAAVAVLVSHGFVSRSDGVKRGTGAPENTRKLHSAVPKRDVRRPPLPPDERKGTKAGQHLAAGSKRPLYGDAGPHALQGPFGTGRLLLRAASSPSALLDSLRRNGSPQEAGEVAPDATCVVGTSGVTEFAMENRLGAEKGGSTTSLEALVASAQQQAAVTSPRMHMWGEGKASVETEASIALVITEEAPQPSGEGPQPTHPGAQERGTSAREGTEPVVVPTFPPVSSMAITSPLDPRRLSLRNPVLAPYTAAAVTSLQKSVPYWGSGSYFATTSYSGAFGGPASLRQSFDRPVVPSPKHHMPSGIRGACRVTKSSSDLSSPESQCSSSISPQGPSSGNTKEEQGEVLSGLVMSLADAARRSAGADAQHLRDAVQALQKSALAKLGTGPEGAGTAISNDGSGILSRVTTGAAGPESDGDQRSPLGDAGTQDTPQKRGFNVLPPLRLAWRRLRFRSSSTDMARHAFRTGKRAQPSHDAPT